MDKVHRLLFSSVVGLVLTAGCGSGYRYTWVGPGIEQEIAQVRDQCGGDYLVIGPGELGRVGTNQASLFTEYQAKKTPLALSHYKRLLFIKCMESKGYRLEPATGGTQEPVEEVPVNVTSSNFDEPSCCETNREVNARNNLLVGLHPSRGSRLFLQLRDG